MDTSSPSNSLKVRDKKKGVKATLKGGRIRTKARITQISANEQPVIIEASLYDINEAGQWVRHKYGIKCVAIGPAFAEAFLQRAFELQPELTWEDLCRNLDLPIDYTRKIPIDFSNAYVGKALLPLQFAGIITGHGTKEDPWKLAKPDQLRLPNVTPFSEAAKRAARAVEEQRRNEQQKPERN